MRRIKAEVAETARLEREASYQGQPRRKRRNEKDDEIRRKRTDNSEPNDIMRDLSASQSKWSDMFIGLMAPSGPAFEHPAAPMLLEFATQGCPVETGPPWPLEVIEGAISKGAHPSAQIDEAATALRNETLEKVEQGYARLVNWDDIKDSPPSELKVHPIAAIPHKSRAFRMILDLSHGPTVDGVKHKSVNETTDPTTAAKEREKQSNSKGVN